LTYCYWFEILDVMKLPKFLTTVTPLSKTLAAILFITFPVLGFLLGIEYQKVAYEQITDKSPFLQKLFCRDWETVCDPNSPNDVGGCSAMRICVDPSTAPTMYTPSVVPTSIPTPTPTRSGQNDMGVACTADAKMCPDGSYVSRQGPNCEFAPCPGE
jgi:hypothetical protein